MSVVSELPALKIKKGKNKLGTLDLTDSIAPPSLRETPKSGYRINAITSIMPSHAKNKDIMSPTAVDGGINFSSRNSLNTSV